MTNHDTTPKSTIHLQGIGKVLAKPAGDLAVGDTTTWNYGYRYTVVAVEPCGAKSIYLTEQAADGRTFTRRMSRTRLVAA